MVVKLQTSDNEEFTVDKDVAERSVLIKQMLEGEKQGPSFPSSSHLFRARAERGELRRVSAAKWASS